MGNSIIYARNNKSSLGTLYKRVGHNKDTFGMYRSAAATHKINKDEFIKELKKIGQIPVRTEKEQQQRAKYLIKKYKTYAFSERTIIKILEAYSHCISNWERQGEGRMKRKSYITKSLPIYLKNKKVDARAIKRVLNKK